MCEGERKRRAGVKSLLQRRKGGQESRAGERDRREGQRVRKESAR
jgi:hypothetical protein